MQATGAAAIIKREMGSSGDSDEHPKEIGSDNKGELAEAMESGGN